MGNLPGRLFEMQVPSAIGPLGHLNFRAAQTMPTKAGGIPKVVCLIAWKFTEVVTVGSRW